MTCLIRVGGLHPDQARHALPRLRGLSLATRIDGTRRTDNEEGRCSSPPMPPRSVHMRRIFGGEVVGRACVAGPTLGLRRGRYIDRRVLIKEPKRLQPERNRV